MNIYELKDELKTRVFTGGQDQKHDKDLFLKVLVAGLEYPDDRPELITLYMMSLSDSACKEAIQMTDDFFAGKIKWTMKYTLRRI